MDYKIYEQLDRDQQELLCFYAFVGGAVNDQIISKYAKANSDTTKAIVPRIKSLFKFST